MPRPKSARKPGDLSSGTTPKRREITDADRHKVIVAILAETDRTWRDLPRYVMNRAGSAATVHRADAEAIAGFAGWPNRDMLEAARDRYAALAGVGS